MVTLCLRSIRKHTRDVDHEVIVVDNGSQDDSLDYLRSLSWIRLIERGDTTPASAVLAHQSALEVALNEARGRFVLTTHTDVVVKRDGWLDRLMQPMQANDRCVAVGSEKLKLHSPLNVWCRRTFDTKRFKLWVRRRLLGDATATFRDVPRHPRDFYTLYRTEVLRRHDIKFVSLGDMSAGEFVYRRLTQLGYDAAVLSAREMRTFIDHVEHGTPAAHRGDRSIKRRTQRRAQRRLENLLAQPYVRELSAAVELDT